MANNPYATNSEVDNAVTLTEGGVSYRMMLPHHQTDYIQHRISSEGRPYEVEMLEDMSTRLKPGDHVIDVGANVGNHTLYLAAVAGCHVTAFEPNPELADAIRASVKINGINDRIVVHQTGVGAVAGRGHFAHLDPGNLGAQQIKISDDEDSLLEIISLDGLDWEHHIDAIKIDVEGMELAVLQGAIKLIKRDNPTLYVECQTELDFEAIHDFLSGYGYACVRTFNATPTQLYLHESQLGEEWRIEDFLRDMARSEYRMARNAADLRRKFDEANAKYRNANEQISALKLKLDTANEKYRQVTESLVAIKQKQQDDRDDKEIRAMEAELKVMEQKYLHAQEEISELTHEVSETETLREEEKETLTRRYQASEQALAEVAERLNSVEAEMTRAQEDHNAARNLHQSEYEDLMQRYRNNEEDLSRLQAEHSALNSRFKELEASHRRIAMETAAPGFVPDAISEKYHQNTVEQIIAFKQKIEYQNKRINDLETQVKAYKSLAGRKIAELRGSTTYRAGVYLRDATRSWRALAALHLRLWRLWRQWRVNKRRRQSSVDPTAAINHTLPAGQFIDDLLQCNLPERSERKLRVACVMDDFTFSSFEPECELHPLTPVGWVKEIRESRPDLLFIESAWRGKDELWGSKVGHTCQELQEIIQWCRVHHIPTIFWNKEDPIHFETFLNTARLFDFIFTTDIDCIQRYKAELGHNRVYLLPFACQPAIHNPIEKYQRKDAFCFAGAYYSRYHERIRDLECFVRTFPNHRPVVIYDRNHGKDHPDYSFPELYRPYIIGSLPFAEIDKAYKGYQYAINLNSIKQSQTMFARRVYELLASNTITVSNYSRGLRLLFGDLVLCSDSGDEIIRRLASLSTDESQLRKFRLAGLRKVMKQHTYQDRLAYIAAKVEGKSMQSQLPAVLVTAYADDQLQFDKLVGHFMRQNHPDKHLLVVTGDGFQPRFTQIDRPISIVQSATTDGITLAALADRNAWVAGMVPDDYYGPNYLTDLVLATRYCTAPVIGKVAHHVWSEDATPTIDSPNAAYRVARNAAYRSSIVKMQKVGQLKLREWVTGLFYNHIEDCDVQAIDEFNYCKNGAIEEAVLTTVESAVNDLTGLDEGIDLSELIERAEQISPEGASIDRSPAMTGDELAGYFRPRKHRYYQHSVDGQCWMIRSTLPDGRHEYIYAVKDVSPAEIGLETHARFHLDVSPGLNIQMVMLFLDRKKDRIGHIVSPANRNIDADIPEGTIWIRLGIRIYSFGAASINGLVLGHRSLQPTEMIERSEYLLLTNHYPSYDDLYRNAFVHTRVKGYQDHGVSVDVFRLRKEESLSYHEYQNVDVITGSHEALHKLLSNGRYQHVLVHFLDPDMWSILKDHISNLRVTVWVHGAEIHPWYRRKFNIDSPEQESTAKIESDKRMSFWNNLLRQIPANLNLIFVSKTFAEEVMEDLGFRLPENQFTIIHNPIDTELFNYVPKPPEQRKKILSIRPFSSRQYANDLTVNAILLLSKQPCFNELEFRIIGDGKLFEEIVAPLRTFENVHIEQRFLERSEISSLHKQYGIFLCPTRWDSQGVSRDEAMSSGLVPITSRAAAVPEFIDESCGIFSEFDDSEGLANGIIRLVEDPSCFLSLSENAASHVRGLSSDRMIYELEMSMFCDTPRLNKND